MVKHRPSLPSYSICLKLAKGQLHCYWEDPTQKHQVTKFGMASPSSLCHTWHPVVVSPGTVMKRLSSFIKDFFIFILCVWMVVLPVCMYTTCMQCPQSPKDGVKASRPGIVSLHMAPREGRQQVLLGLSHLSSLDISSLFSGLRWQIFLSTHLACLISLPILLSLVSSFLNF